jgi:acetylornithine deacetylase
MNVAPGDALELTRALVRIDSRNPDLMPGAPGERGAAVALAGVLTSWGFRVTLQDTGGGRPNVVARIGSARRGAPVLMFNGHLDVVGVEGMTHPPFDGRLESGRVHGRGATDMKGGVASMCAAAWHAQQSGLAGEIVVAAVVDEEFESLGTRTLLANGVRADAAVVTEPTRLAIAPAHRGFTWVEITCRGRAAHGSRYDTGIDAIRHAGHILTELDRLEQEELVKHTHPLLGHASLHAATVAGGVGWSTYPDRCTLRVERRTLPGDQIDAAVQEVEACCRRVQQRVPSLDAQVNHVFTQRPSDVALDAPIVQALRRALEEERVEVRVEGLSAWTDAALLNEAGIPAICFGPGDIARAHSDEEWVSVAEIELATSVLARLARAWCGEG